MKASELIAQWLGRELGPLLAKAVAGSGVSIVEVPVDYAENTKLTARLGLLVCPIEMRSAAERE